MQEIVIFSNCSRHKMKKFLISFYSALIVAFSAFIIDAAPAQKQAINKSDFEVTTPDGKFFHVDIKYAVAFFEKKTSPTGGSVLFCNKKNKNSKKLRLRSRLQMAVVHL